MLTGTTMRTRADSPEYPAPDGARAPNSTESRRIGTDRRPATSPRLQAGNGLA
jgi:hypothetical protein